MTRWAQGQNYYFRRECDSATGRATAATQGNRAPYCLRSHRKPGDRPLNPVVESVLGVPGKGWTPEGVAAGRVARGAPGDLAGIPWVDYVATKARRTSAEGGAGVPAAAPLRQPTASHRVCRAPPLRLTQRRQTPRAGG